MRRALVVGNSELPPQAVVRAWWDRADLVVAADGGGQRLLGLGLEPHVVVGDLDSLRGSVRRRLGSRRILKRSGRDRTDLEKAIAYAHEHGCGDVTVLGGSQGRLDHVLGNVSLLLDWSRRLRIRLVDADFTTERVDGRVTFRAPPGTVVSLYAPQGARGVTTGGLRWALHESALAPGTRGIHNQVVRNPVVVSVRQGDLLLMRGHRVDPHI